MPPLLVISGPSGIGKTYLFNLLGERGFGTVIMTTTRPPRPEEVDGVDYEFLTPAEYDRASADFWLDNQFFGHRYGTRRSLVASIRAAGFRPVMGIYVGVIDQVVSAYPDSLRVYLMPQDETLLADRLRRRNSTPDHIEYRLAKAREELALLDDPAVRGHFHELITVKGDQGEQIADYLVELTTI